MDSKLWVNWLSVWYMSKELFTYNPLLLTDLCSHSQFHDETLNPIVATIGDRDFKEVIKVQWGHKGGSPTPQDWCLYKKRKKHQTTMWGHSHKALSATWREPSPETKPTLPAPLFWTAILQNCEKINSCCLSHVVCSTLLWQSEKTNIPTESLKLSDTKIWSP